MDQPIVSSFLDKLIDWKEFELFVSELYEDSDEVKVEHNITLTGKSNAKRQIDVLVTQTTKLHTYKTIIECKRWKKPVTRQVIDVMFATVEDLNANKGVIFTTKGFEEGAVEYAASKGIDIFIVRDIREDEYGNLGKTFSLYLQIFNARLENFEFRNQRWFSLNGSELISPIPAFELHFTKDQIYPSGLQLTDLDYNKGPHFIKLLIDIRGDMLKRRLESFQGLIETENETAEMGFKTRVTLDFTKYTFKFIPHDDGFLELNTVSFDFINGVDQTKMNFDRTAAFDFALIVENYISRQRNYVSKPKAEEKITLSEPVTNEIIDESKLVQPGSVIKVSTEHYINFALKEHTNILETKEITYNIIL